MYACHRPEGSVQWPPTQHSCAVDRSLSEATGPLLLELKTRGQQPFHLFSVFALVSECALFKFEQEGTTGSGWAKLLPAFL